MKKVPILFLFLLLCRDMVNAQAVNLDSLTSATNNLSDTDTLKIFNYCDLALKYGASAENDKALASVKKAELIIDKCTNPRIKALFYYAAGYINYLKLNYKESLSYLLKSLKLYEEQKNKRKMVACYTVIGLLYQDQTFYETAQMYLEKSLALRIEIQDSMRLSGNYSNLGLNFYKIAQKKKTHSTDCYEIREAIKNLNTALVIARRMKIPVMEANALGNLSNIMNDKKQFKESLKYAERALEIYQNLGDTYDENISLIDIGSVYLGLNKPKEALPFFEQSLNLSITNNFRELERFSYINFVLAYEKMNDFKNAFAYQKKIIALNDSIFNSDNLKQINEMQIKYETEKKESENALLLVKNELSDKAIKNQKLVIFFIIGGLILTLVFAFFIFKGLSKQKQANRIISKQKKEVEDKNLLINEQHELLEEKQKEIIDSIYYAKRIQRAHLPTEKYIGKNIDKLKNKI